MAKWFANNVPLTTVFKNRIPNENVRVNLKIYIQPTKTLSLMQ